MASQPDLPAIREEEQDGGKMSLFEHLADLRKRLIYSALAIAIGFVIGFSVSKKVIDFIVQPMVQALRQAHYSDKLIYTSPAGFVNLLITLGFY
ncbi:MAG: twin-arginine translocase subunit TatC, partial [Candidatus Acidiferrales bacterium]